MQCIYTFRIKSIKNVDSHSGGKQHDGIEFEYKIAGKWSKNLT